MTPEEVVKQTNRERYLERLKKNHPDREYEDDEALFAQVNDDYDESEKQIGELRGYENEITKMIDVNPASAAFLSDWKNGVDPIVALIRRFGDDFKAALEDPAKLEQIAEANKEYAERVAQNKKYEEEYKKNIAESLVAVEKMEKEENIPTDKMDEALAALELMAKDVFSGIYSVENVRMALKAINYDADLADASREGEVRGRNAKIQERLRKSSRGDGTADLAGTNGRGASIDRPEFGALNRYGAGNSTIYERGGEKRIPYKDR